jgi:hypothetical protein
VQISTNFKKENIMKKMVLLLIAVMLMCGSALAWEQLGKIPAHKAGSALIAKSTTELTDAAPQYNAVVMTSGYQDLTVDVITDKGGTLIITPILDVDDEATLGAVSDTLTVADGGPSGRAIYASISAPKAKVLFTKTEAGTTSGFKVSVRGTLD